MSNIPFVTKTLYLTHSEHLLEMNLVLNHFRRFSSLSRGFDRQELKNLCKATPPIKAYLPSSGGDPDGGYAEKRVLVMMVGWAQSRQSALSKYAAIYTNLGIPCVALAADIRLFWFTQQGNAAARNMLNILDDSIQQPVSLLLHIFSGGGLVVFPQLLSEQSKSNSLLTSKLLPAGVIFDSGPSQFGMSPGFAAAKLVYKQGGYNFFTYSIACCLGALTNLAVGSKKRAGRQTALENPTLLQMPQLYLHSEADTVCPPGIVREVMDGQKALGRTVSSHCWEGVDHVRLYSQHPEEYTNKITDFIKTLGL